MLERIHADVFIDDNFFYVRDVCFVISFRVFSVKIM